jgi:ATP-dependent Clp protease ATP-binding subunit ClpC
LWLVFERFTESARQVMINAQEVAREFGHARVEPEHELLGLLADPDSDASRALGSLGVTADRARERVVEIVPLGAQRTGSVIPFTPGAKKVLELALREALALGHPHIAPGHLLLGLAHDRDGVAMQVLVSLGADQTAVRDAVAPLLPKAGPPIPQASRPQPGIVTSAPIIRRVLEAAAGRALNEPSSVSAICSRRWLTMSGRRASSLLSAPTSTRSARHSSANAVAINRLIDTSFNELACVAQMTIVSLCMSILGRIGHRAGG